MLEKYEKYIILMLCILGLLMSITIYILYSYEIIPENSINYEKYKTIQQG